MGTRAQLHQILETFSDHVYFQPPENVKLEYPCIIYKLDLSEVKFADGIPYNLTWRYMVVAIDHDPDGDIPTELASMKMSLFNRFYTADDLNHYVFNVFF